MRAKSYIIYSGKIMELDLKDKRKTEKVVEAYSDMIMRIAYQNLKCIHEAEDVMQDVFLALINKRKFADDEHLKAWLIRVTVNKCRDVLRKKRRNDLPLDVAESFMLSPEHSGILEEIFELPPDDRTVIYLHYYEGYNAAEIGKILKKSENAIYIKLTRAREKLKVILINEGENE